MTAHRREWLPAEDKFIRDNWQQLTREEMGKHIGRTKDAVTKRGRIMLGLGDAPRKHSRLMQGAPIK